MKKIMMTLLVGLMAFTSTAYGQDADSGFSFSLKPAKLQAFNGYGAVVVDGNITATNTVAGFATIHPVGKGFFLRPYAAVGQVNPEKAGVGNFLNTQVGILLGKKVSKRFSLLAGASVTGLFPPAGDQYRPTLNFATATVVKKFRSGALQVLTPVSINRAPNGDWNMVAVLGIGFVF